MKSTHLGISGVRYGALQVAKNHEAGKIWRSRNVEPASTEGEQWLWTTDEPSFVEQIERREVVCKVVDLAELRRNEKTVIALRTNGYSLEEAGQIMQVTRERIRQIEVNALKKLRRQMVKLGLWSEDFGFGGWQIHETRSGSTGIR